MLIYSPFLKPIIRLQNCCIDKTEFGDMNLCSVDMRNCGYDEQEWTVEQLGENISM